MTPTNTHTHRECPVLPQALREAGTAHGMILKAWQMPSAGQVNRGLSSSQLCGSRRQCSGVVSCALPPLKIGSLVSATAYSRLFYIGSED